MFNDYQYNIEDVKNHVSYTDFARGVAYHSQNRVSNLKAEKNKLAANVQGTRFRPYDVEAQIINEQGKKSFIATCSCPVAFGCKHIVATLLSGIDHFSNVTSIQNISQPQPIKLNYHLSNWIESLSPKAKDNDSGKLLIYIIEGSTKANVAFKVSSLTISVLKKGMFGVSKPYRLDQIHNPAKYVQEDDLMILRFISSLMPYYYGGYNTHDIPVTLDANILLQLLIKTGRCYLPNPYFPEKNLSIGESRKAFISWKAESDGSQSIKIDVDGVSFPIIMPMYPPYYICPNTRTIGMLQTDMPDKQAVALLRAPTISPEQVALVSEKLSSILTNPELMPKALPIRKLEIKPIPHLKLTSIKIQPKKKGWGYSNQDHVEIAAANLYFDYQGKKLNHNDSTQEITSYKNGEVLSIQRDKIFEQGCTELLKHMGMTLRLGDVDDYYNTKQEHKNIITIGNIQEEFHKEANLSTSWTKFTKESIPKLKEMEWQIKMDKVFPYNIVEVDDEWYANIDEGSEIDWFSVELGVTVEGQHFNLVPILLDLLKNNKDFSAKESLFIPMKDGRKLSIPSDRAQILLNTLEHIFSFQNLSNKNNKLNLQKLDAALIAEIETAAESLNMRWFGGDKIRSLGKRLKEFTEISSSNITKNFKGELRHYQQDGLNWLQFLREFELAGILADDMGLGKTVQVLAHIAKEKEEGRLESPILVVAPTSLMVNWRMEAERFVPDLKVITLHGANRKKHFNEIKQYDLVLTTYPLLARDKDNLLNYKYHTVILDEAQIIKNTRAKVTQIANQLKSQHRLCLTGTPLENHLGELWSLFNFLLPGYLGTQQQFGTLFRNPIEKNGDATKGQILLKRIKPFILRRTKQQVVTELPPKTEMIRKIELEGVQRDLYETIRVSMHKKILKEIKARGMDKSHIIILDALLKLRQVCCDPALLKMNIAKNITESAKCNELMNMIPAMIEEGRKILLFSQFTSMLALIEKQLDLLKIPYVKLTGQTKDRESPIRDFQEGKVPLFLISLKAGGTGLNLTSADTVIHYDPWWNPAVENQATDRAYRIGQDKPVFVYKLITVGTVEEKILEMQEKKRKLADALFNPSEQSNSKLTSEDIQTLFEPLE